MNVGFLNPISHILIVEYARGSVEREHAAHSALHADRSGVRSAQRAARARSASATARCAHARSASTQCAVRSAAHRQRCDARSADRGAARRCVRAARRQKSAATMRQRRVAPEDITHDTHLDSLQLIHLIWVQCRARTLFMIISA